MSPSVTYPQFRNLGATCHAPLDDDGHTPLPSLSVHGTRRRAGCVFSNHALQQLICRNAKILRAWDWREEAIKTVADGRKSEMDGAAWKPTTQGGDLRHLSTPQVRRR